MTNDTGTVLRAFVSNLADPVDDWPADARWAVASGIADLFVDLAQRDAVVLLVLAHPRRVEIASNLCLLADSISPATSDEWHRMNSAAGTLAYAVGLDPAAERVAWSAGCNSLADLACEFNESGLGGALIGETILVGAAAIWARVSDEPFVTSQIETVTA